MAICNTATTRLQLLELVGRYGLKVKSLPILFKASLTRPACMFSGRLLSNLVSVEGLLEGKWSSCTRVDWARDQEGEVGREGRRQFN